MKRFLLALFIIVLAAFWGETRAGVSRTKVKKGVEAYKKSSFDNALNNFQDALLDDPENPLLHFNMGDALYKKKKYADALKSFEKALSTRDVKLQEKAYYNIGNVHYQQNEYQKAIEAYKRALDLDPKDKQAKHNLELVRAKLKENAKKQQSSPQQNSGKGQGKNQQNQQKQNGQQQKQGKQQQQPGSDQQKKETKQRQDRKKSEQQKPGQENQPQQAQPRNGKGQKKPLSKEEAEQILRALRSKERENKKLRPLPRQSGRRHVEKDW